MVIMKARLGWCGYAECRNEADWDERCLTMNSLMETDRTRQEGTSEEDLLDCVKERMESRRVPRGCAD